MGLKKILLLFSGLVASVTAEAQSHLVWSDEFDYEGRPDSARWDFEHGLVRNEELQWYQPENAYCKGGLLVIEAQEDSLDNPFFREGRAGDWRSSRSRIVCTSASLHTAGKFDFTYGSLEVRARIPLAKGAWPAIWLLGTQGEWPDNGEIDVMEFYRKGGVPVIMANAAWGSGKRWEAVWNSVATPLQHFLNQNPDWGTEFHIWRMDWTEESIALFLDDELLNEIPLNDAGGSASPFHSPFYILLNLAVGGINGGPTAENAWPIRYEIDYVRVYQ